MPLVQRPLRSRSRPELRCVVPEPLNEGHLTPFLRLVQLCLQLPAQGAGAGGFDELEEACHRSFS